MNLIYVILAHKKPIQLHRLIQSLAGITTTFVVHIDITENLSTFSDLFLGREDVFFIENRSYAKWGSFGLVEATLSALVHIKELFPKTDRVTLLSGQDYPIKSTQHIISHFRANPDLIYMEYFPIPVKKWITGGINRFPNFQTISKSLKLYGGSQWWSFPMKVVIEILSILEDYPSFIEYFRMAVIPDESFFQTLLLNSEEPIILNNLAKHNLSFIRWDFPGLRPRTILSKDLNLLLRSDKFFARKFDENVDPTVFDLIDKSILNPKEYQKNKKIYKKTSVKASQAICMLTNKHASLSKFKKLAEEIPEKAVSYLLYHKKEGQDVDEKIVSQVKNLFVFDNSILSSLGYTPIAPSLLPGSNHFPLFSLYKSQPDYDYYWLIEDDVHYNGKWIDLFNNFSPEKIKADFISCNIRVRQQEPYWYWWNSLTKKDSSDIAFKVASFNPIYRISREALIYLDKQLKSGWTGHHEVLIPTLLIDGGFTMIDFGGTGSFCLSSKKNRTYKSGEIINGTMVDNGTVRYRPAIRQDEIKEKLLYHPVKF